MLRLLLISMGLTALTVLVHGGGTFYAVLHMAELWKKRPHPPKPLVTQLTGQWRLLGPTEAVVGVLMLGWSTGIMVAVITKLIRARYPDLS